MADGSRMSRESQKRNRHVIWNVALSEMEDEKTIKAKYIVKHLLWAVLHNFIVRSSEPLSNLFCCISIAFTLETWPWKENVILKLKYFFFFYRMIYPIFTCNIFDRIKAPSGEISTIPMVMSSEHEIIWSL